MAERGQHPGPDSSGLPDILRRITAQRRRRLEEASEITGDIPLLETAPPLSRHENAFLAALHGRRGRAVIAEVKMGSPRLGSLAGQVDPEKQARLYAAHGAAALSVVVEPDFFHGSYELLAACREASGLPAIAKDFVVHPLQLWWAKRAKADAVLLIASLYSPETLRWYAGMARHLGLVPLVETHDAADLAKLAAGESGGVGEGSWELVGVNNRDLRTFEVSLEHSEGLVAGLPAEALRVAESGIRGGGDVRRLAAAGFDAFLVGEALLLAEDPESLLREMVAG